MNSPEIKKFIKEHSHLFWYTPEDKKEEISKEFLVETIFNYGSMDDIRKLFHLIGTETLAEIHANIRGRKKNNYFPEMYNYFSLLVKRYA